MKIIQNKLNFHGFARLWSLSHHSILLFMLSMVVVSAALFSCAPGTTARTVTLPPTYPQFLPNNPLHLLVSQVGTTTPIDGVSVSEEAAQAGGNPTIVISGLTNISSSLMDVPIIANITVFVNENTTNVFSTPDNANIVVPITNPEGAAATNVTLTAAIMITNLFGQGTADDEIITYSIRVEFSPDTTVQFDPTNPFHLLVSRAGSTVPIPEVSVSEEAAQAGGNPTIVISGLTNISSSPTDAPVIANITALVAANSNIFSVPPDNMDIVVPVTNPEGAAATNVTLTAAIMITNLFGQGTGDDVPVTYDIRVEFSPDTTVQFTPTNPFHLNVLVEDANVPPERVMISEEAAQGGGNPTIVISGLTNIRDFSPVPAVLANVTVFTNANIFSTPGNTNIVMPIIDPTGIEATNVTLTAAIMVTNIFGQGTADDVPVTYDIRVELSPDVTPQFDPTNTNHLRVSLVDATVSIDDVRVSVEAAQGGGNPTIIISGLTNISSATAVTLANITVFADANTTNIFSTPDNMDIVVPIIDISGTDMTNVLLIHKIRVTNLNGPKNDDNEVRTYNIRVDFGGSFASFDPTNTNHLLVSLNGETTPRGNVSVRPIAGANPLITITLMSISNNFIPLNNKWTVTVFANVPIFSTSTGENIVQFINDPVGGVASTNIPNAFIIINENGTGPDDDVAITYDIEIDFSAVNALFSVQVTSEHISSSPSVFSPGEPIPIITPCTAMSVTDYVLLADGLSNHPYTLDAFRTYYDRSSVNENRVIDPNTGEVIITEKVKILDSASSDVAVAIFTFNQRFTPCLVSHLGTGKTGADAANAYELSRTEHFETLAYIVNTGSPEADKHYTLTTDVDLEQPGLPWSKSYGEATGARGFTPIGRYNPGNRGRANLFDSCNPYFIPSLGEIRAAVVESDTFNAAYSFRGKFTCNYNVINNLYINDRNRKAAGLFGFVNGGEINGCRLENVDVRGEYSVGGLVGHLKSYKYQVGAPHRVGDVSYSYTTGKVDGKAVVGGLVGNVASAVVRSSYSISVVTGNTAVGGLVGGLASPVTSRSNANRGGSVSGGVIRAHPTDTGFVVGTHPNTGGAVMESYAAGAVRARAGSAGGLVGEMVSFSSLIKDSYATGNVVANINRAASGYVRADGAAGGLVGHNSVGFLGSFAQPTVGDIPRGPSIFNYNIYRTYAVPDSLAGDEFAGGLVAFAGGWTPLTGVSTDIPHDIIAASSTFGVINSYWSANSAAGSVGGRRQSSSELTSGRPYPLWNTRVEQTAFIPRELATQTWSFASGRYPILNNIVCTNRQTNPSATECTTPP